MRPGPSRRKSQIGPTISSRRNPPTMPKAKTAKSDTRAARLQFIEPMYAQLVQQLPDGKDWLYEVKFDGYRCLAGRDAARVTLWSRRGNDFTAQFPNIAIACEQLPAGTLLDGEIVAVDENGRISFNLLQHHRSQAHALLFYAFDVLIYRGMNLVNEPVSKRREVLSDIMRPLARKATAVSLSDSRSRVPLASRKSGQSLGPPRHRHGKDRARRPTQK